MKQERLTYLLFLSLFDLLRNAWRTLAWIVEHIPDRDFSVLLSTASPSQIQLP